MDCTARVADSWHVHARGHGRKDNAQMDKRAKRVVLGVTLEAGCGRTQWEKRLTLSLRKLQYSLRKLQYSLRKLQYGVLTKYPLFGRDSLH